MKRTPLVSCATATIHTMDSESPPAGYPVLRVIYRANNTDFCVPTNMDEIGDGARAIPHLDGITNVGICVSFQDPGEDHSNSVIHHHIYSSPRCPIRYVNSEMYWDRSGGINILRVRDVKRRDLPDWDDDPTGFDRLPGEV